MILLFRHGGNENRLWQLGEIVKPLHSASSSSLFLLFFLFCFVLFCFFVFGDKEGVGVEGAPGEGTHVYVGHLTFVKEVSIKILF